MTDLQARIAVRAYFLWLDASRPDGQHEAHWLAAEAVERAERKVRNVAAIREAEAAEQAEAAARAAKRSASARKAAATRKANKAAAEALLAADMGARLGRIAARDAAARHVTH